MASNSTTLCQTAFIMLCEYFLGIRPHFGLWRRYFLVRVEKNGKDIYDCVGADIMLAPSAGYLKGSLPDSIKKW